MGINMDYVRVAKGGFTNYELVPDDVDIQSLINPNEPAYISLYKYNENHYELWKKTGKVAGVKDVYTNQIYFDFDSSNIESARKDAVTTVNRLISDGIKEDYIEIAFTGKKGFSVRFEIEKDLTPKEFKKVVKHYAGDLETYDTRVADPNRVVRIVGTKHQDTDYYKTRLTLKQLNRLRLDGIYNLASKPRPNPEIYSVDLDVDDVIKEDEVVNSTKLIETPNHNIDFSNKPKWLSKPKYILHLGLFPRGEGLSNDAYMTLAATYKNQGFTEDQTLALLNTVADRQAAIYNCEKYDEYELEKNVVNTVYSPTWNNGQYTYENNTAIAYVVEKYNLKEELIIPDIVDIGELSSNFKRFASEIDQNTIKLGIDSVDDKIRITTSMLVCLLAAPSAGKTSIALEILSNTSNRNINSFFFSLDMGQPLVYQRLIQKHTGAKSDDIFDKYKNDEATDDYDENVSDNYANVKFCFKSGVNVDQMKQIISDANSKLDERIKLVVIDYLECISGPYSDPTANTSLIAQQLKDLANELDVTVLLLVQPQKHAGDPSSELLSYRNIKGASAIEQAASIVLTLWRAGFSAKHPEEDRFASIAAVKNRMGGLGTFDFFWNGVCGSIGELDYEGREELKELRERRAREKAESDKGGFGR